MDNEAIKSILNPIRLKIINELGLRKQATTKELAESLSDIPQATLYRHTANLLKNKVIKVIEEHQVKGILEKVYALNTELGSPLNIDIQKMTKKDLADLYTQFTIGLLSDFQHCLSETEDIQRCKTNIGFHSMSLYLSDEELIEMMQAVNKVMLKQIDNKANPGRKLRKISTVVTTSSALREEH